MFAWVGPHQRNDLNRILVVKDVKFSEMPPNSGLCEFFLAAHILDWSTLYSIKWRLSAIKGHIICIVSDVSCSTRKRTQIRIYMYFVYTNKLLFIYHMKM